MFHEHLQANIVREDSLTRTSGLRGAIHGRGHVRRRGVELRQQESRLTATLIADDVSWDREAVTEEVLCISNWRFQQLLEIFVAFLILISSLPPLGNGLSMEDKDMEERVKEEDDVRFDGNTVKEYRLGWDVKGVRHECRLNHDQRVVDVFFVEDMSIKSSFIWTVIEKKTARTDFSANGT